MRSLTSCIACPTCLKTAFMLRVTTLLMPRSTPHVASGLVALSSSTAVTAWPRFVFWHNMLEPPRFFGMEGQLCKVWDGLHVSPRTAPSKRAKLCTSFAWFLRPGQLKPVPYFELPMPISRLELLIQLRTGSHALPVEQGRLARPAIPRHLRHCTLCQTRTLGDERHTMFDSKILPTFAARFGHVTRMPTVPCSILCGTRTRRLSAIAQQPLSTWLMTQIRARPHELIHAEWTD